MAVHPQLKLNLLENSFDYLAASLEYVARARNEKSEVAWKFAILNLTFAIELLLKERLRRENELLIYADLDKYKEISRETRTVSWKVLLERTKYVLGQRYDKYDCGRLSLAQKLRNQMLHYDTVLNFPDVYHDFANLLNFYTSYFNGEVCGSEDETLHDHVPDHLWKEQEDLSDAFYEEVVYYNGIFMGLTLRDEIIAEQSKNILVINGVQYLRIPYGSPSEWANDNNFEYSQHLCHDCSVAKGQIHLLGCDMERCPKCEDDVTLISCGCEFDYLNDNP